MQEERLKRRMKEELKIEEIKLQMNRKNEDKDIIVNRNIQVKLLMLVITEFEGTYQDWFRFWDQFQTEIDKIGISAINKFFYPKEFLIPKARALIDGLPFTPERYLRAKSILLAKFGKSSEVATVATYLPSLLSLIQTQLRSTNSMKNWLDCQCVRSYSWKVTGNQGWYGQTGWWMTRVELFNFSWVMVWL